MTRTKLENTSLSAHIIPQISYLKTRIFFPDSIIIVDIIVISDKLYSENDFYGVFFLTADGGVIYFYQKDEDLFMEKNLTSGSVLKTVIYFSLPYLLSYFLQTLYGMADLFIIGQFGGVDGTTAVSVGSQVMHMLTVMIVGLAMGATVLIGRAVGAGDRKLAARGIGNTISLFAGLSILLTGLLLTAVLCVG